MQFKVPNDDEVYDFISSKFTFGEGKALEKVTGMTMATVVEGGPESQSMAALQAVFWISMKRKRPTLAYVELDDLAIDDIEFIPEDDEEKADAEEVGPTNPAPEPGAGVPEPAA